MDCSSPFPEWAYKLNNVEDLYHFILGGDHQALACSTYGDDYLRPDTANDKDVDDSTVYTTSDGVTPAKFIIFGEVLQGVNLQEPFRTILIGVREAPLNLKIMFENQIQRVGLPVLCDFRYLGETRVVFSCTGVDRQSGGFGHFIEVHTDHLGAFPCCVHSGYGIEEVTHKPAWDQSFPVVPGDWIIAEVSYHVRNLAEHTMGKSYELLAHHLRVLPMDKDQENTSGAGSDANSSDAAKDQNNKPLRRNSFPHASPSHFVEPRRSTRLAEKKKKARSISPEV
ncbi:hypothetical protein R3P38DRAFT_3175260 [Favolaschia claudopus]|uniref:Uncharacterized protein n=1 Tax=Favolaschia claudopus TaxID=2862362 RepID=A0AAW0DCX2_9AGAR